MPGKSKKSAKVAKKAAAAYGGRRRPGGHDRVGARATAKGLGV